MIRIFSLLSEKRAAKLYRSVLILIVQRGLASLLQMQACATPFETEPINCMKQCRLDR